jgi:hypothetical protein
MEHSKHIIRVFLLVFLVLVVATLGRALLTPRSFGRFGHYRADNVVEQVQKPVVFGENEACVTCHEEMGGEVNGGAHKQVVCEDCHAPLATHIKGGEKVGRMETHREAVLCLRCHEYIEARPKVFPQIRAEEHLKKAMMEMSPDVCFNCHSPHTPKIGG